MKFYLCIWCTLLYIFTAQFTVHAFAMHGGSHSIHHGTYISQEDHCGDKDHDMTLCLEQSMGAFVEYVPSIIQNTYPKPHNLTYRTIFPQLVKNSHAYGLHDPGGGEHGNFSEYLDQLYGLGIVMHC